MKIEEVFTNNEISNIKQKAIELYKYKAPDPRNTDLFVTSCYISVILEELEKKDLLKENNADS